MLIQQPGAHRTMQHMDMVPQAGVLREIAWLIIEM